MAAIDALDAVIVGGGPAGTATAIALARAGLRAAVIEASGYDAFRIGETVPADLRAVLRELGVWESFAADAAGNIHLPSAGNASARSNSSLTRRCSAGVIATARCAARPARCASRA